MIPFGSRCLTDPLVQIRSASGTIEALSKLLIVLCRPARAFHLYMDANNTNTDDKNRETSVDVVQLHVSVADLIIRLKH